MEILTIFISILVVCYCTSLEFDDYYIKAVESINSMNYKNAIKYLEKAVEIKPYNMDANQLLGYCYYLYLYIIY